MKINDANISTINGFRYMFFNRTTYRLVFEHNYTIDKCFENIDSALNCNQPGKYSILYQIKSHRFKYLDGQRYFFLEYPIENLSIIWSQSLAPTIEEENENTTRADGFVPYLNEGTKMFRGLLRNALSPNDSLIDGSLGTDNWYYSIGMLCSANEFYMNNGFPGIPNGSTTYVRLWAGIPPDLQDQNPSCYLEMSYLGMHINGLILLGFS